ncbi:MAG: NADPH-dependent oxidoreductase [Bacteroides sp.]|nr:NADPH-dependent oxidoreductase [Bacteroides sp.]
MTDYTDYFLSRRSIRRYLSDRKVEPEIITELIEAARMAPNTGNMQLYSVVLTSEPANVANLASKGHFNQPAAAGASAILTFCVDMHRFSQWCKACGTQSSLDNLQGFTWAVMDTSIFAQQFVTLAEMHGLGTCYLGTTTYNAGAISKLLELPKGVIPLISVSVGWPAEDGDEKQRLPLESIMHVEKYHDPSNEEVKEIYRYTEETPESRRFVTENEKPSLAHVFTEVRYPKDGTDAFSQIYLDEIRKAGINI